MMLYPAMNELLEQVPSRYQLVNVVAARARKIAAKAEREDLMLEDKPVSIAIREIAEGHWKDPEEAAGMEDAGIRLVLMTDALPVGEAGFWAVMDLNN